MNRMHKTVISLVVGLGVSLGLLVTGVQAQSGVLDPPPSAVDVSGDPVPTTQTQPSWDQTLPAAERFVLVMPTAANPAGEAVLDKETGMVWEQSPDTNAITWDFGRFHCANRAVGGRKGWILPSINRLSSLVDPGNPGGNPDLPPGHPFSNVQSDSNWSASSFVDNPTFAWVVDFNVGNVRASNKSVTIFVWCVRGDMNADAY